MRNLRHLLLWTGIFISISFRFTFSESPNIGDYKNPEQGRVRILRDTYGVPHVIARDNESMFFGVGFAQAEDQLENIARNYLLSEGRGAEFLGKDQLALDHLVRSLNLPALAEQGYQDLQPEYKAILDSFAAGINAYIEKHRAEIPKWVEPSEPHDSIGLALYVNAMFVMGDCQRDLRRAGINKLADIQLDSIQCSSWGSNQFAVAPSRSATDAAMLSMDPHLPLKGVLRWYEMHQVGADINAMGATFFGLPFVALGRTSGTAWCQTVNAPDLGDVFALKLNPENTKQFRDSEGWKSFETVTETYRVASDDGPIEVQRAVMRSKFGPVVTVHDGVAYTFRLAMPLAKATIQQSLAILRATNLTEFRSALKLRGIAMFNFVYADRNGDTFYISNSLVPKRDARISSHAIRPAEERWADWQGIHDLSELPQIGNPAAGYLMNTNSGPQNVTETALLNPERFPKYMMRQTENSRSRRLAKLLKNDRNVTWDDMLTYATDTKLEVEKPLKHLSRLVEKSDDELVKKSVAVLKKWDHRTDLNSRGAVLFFYLTTDEEMAKALKDGNPQQTANSIRRIASRLEEQFGALDAPWEKFSRIRRGEIEMGIAGSGGNGGMVGAALRPTFGSIVEGRQYCRGGSSYGMVVDFSGKTKAVSCLPFGVSENPKSKHFADMLPLYVQRKFKPAWFLPEEIEGNKETELTLVVQ